MNLLTNDTQHHTNNPNKQIDFKVDTLRPELMIKMVSDMYPNPRRTLLTEYVQNAMDSHRQRAERDPDWSPHPIEITLPTDETPEYVVRDFGVGMTEEDIENTFRYVFRSTKNSNPDDLGGFGIGKLVFGAYTGVMFLDLYDGAERHNFLFRLKDGFAGAQKQFSRACDEERGVRVTIPVLTRDVVYFRNVAVFQYGFMREQPLITGQPDFFKEFNQWCKGEKIYATDDECGVLYAKNELPEYVSKHAGDREPQPQALIGGLPFNINLTTLGENVSENAAQTKLIKRFSDQFFTFWFDSSEVDIVPSRDNLKYNEKTCRALIRRLRELDDALQVYFNELIDSDNVTLLESYRALEQLLSQKIISSDMVDPMSWRAQPSGWFKQVQELRNTMRSGGESRFTNDTAAIAATGFRRGTSRKFNDSKLCDMFGADTPLNQMVEFLVDTISGVRGQRRTRHSWYNNLAGTRQPFDDIRANLLPFTAHIDDHWHEATFVVAAEDEITKVEAGRRINYQLAQNVNPGDLHMTKNTVVLYLNAGVTYQQFVDKLVGMEIGIDPLRFVNANTLQVVPATVSVSSNRGSFTPGNSGMTHFGLNNLFLLSDKGESPSEKFNATFWDALEDPEKELKEMRDANKLILLVDVKAYYPVIDDAMEKCVAKVFVPERFRENMLGDSTRFRKLVMFVEEVSGKSVRIVGVKDRTKLPEGTIGQDFVEYLVRDTLGRSIDELLLLDSKNRDEFVAGCLIKLLRNICCTMPAKSRCRIKTPAMLGLNDELRAVGAGILTIKGWSERTFDALQTFERFIALLDGYGRWHIYHDLDKDLRDRVSMFQAMTRVIEKNPLMHANGKAEIAGYPAHTRLLRAWGEKSFCSIKHSDDDAPAMLGFSAMEGIQEAIDRDMDSDPDTTALQVSGVLTSNPRYDRARLLERAAEAWQEMADSTRALAEKFHTQMPENIPGLPVLIKTLDAANNPFEHARMIEIRDERRDDYSVILAVALFVLLLQFDHDAIFKKGEITDLFGLYSTCKSKRSIPLDALLYTQIVGNPEETDKVIERLSNSIELVFAMQLSAMYALRYINSIKNISSVTDEHIKALT